MAQTIDGLLAANPQILIGSAVLAVFLLSSAAFAMVLRARNGPHARLRRRVAAIVGNTSAADLKKNQTGRKKRRIEQVEGALRELEASKRRSRKRNVLRRELDQSGLKLSIRAFLLAGVALAVVVAALLALAGFDPIIVALAALAMALGPPRWFIRYLGRRRRKKFTDQFAGAVDVIVRGVEYGLPVNDCFGMIARESPDPVGHEFRLILESIRLGMTMEEALDRAEDRISTPEFKFFATVLSIQRETGGNLAETLSNLSKVLRDRHRMLGKIRALSSEARASAAIIGSLPIGVGALLFVVNTAYITLLFTERLGNWMIAGGVLIMTIGTLVMKKMVSFEI